MTSDDPQDDLSDEFETEPVPALNRAVVIAGALVIAAACWFASSRLAQRAFRTFEYEGPDDPSFFDDFIPRVFNWTINAVFAAGVWIAVWMVGVLLITTLHRVVNSVLR